MAKILIVDDDEQVRGMIKLILERDGYEVEEAGDGNEAIEVYCREEFDLVVTDIVMPGKEGIETIMELRGINPKAKIIAISGGGRINPEDYLKWARRFGVTHTFTKPVDRTSLLEAVGELLTEESRVP
ncbi:MAG: response regulator [Gemmatimonadales bacterium]|nr:response regulator [Gemmatimonadales bacterium]